MWTCKKVCSCIYFQGTAPLFCKSPPLNSQFQSSSHTLWFTEAKYEISFFFDRTHLDWQLNKWKIIYCEQSGRLLLAEALSVFEASVCVFKWLNIRCYTSQPSLEYSLYHFQVLKKTRLFLFTRRFRPTGQALGHVVYLWVEDKEPFEIKHIHSFLFPVCGWNMNESIH